MRRRRVPDDRWGEVGHLAIVTLGEPPEAAAILALFEPALARFKHPRHISFIAALPRKGAGKVLKRDLLVDD